VLRAAALSEAAAAEIAGLDERRRAWSGPLSELERIKSALLPEEPQRQAQALIESIRSLQQQEREGERGRIPRRGKLQGDGHVGVARLSWSKSKPIWSRGFPSSERLRRRSDILRCCARLLEEEQNGHASQYPRL